MEQPNYDMEDVGRFQHARLIEERNALRDALREAPEAEYDYIEEDIDWCIAYREWWKGQRQAALGPVEVE